jgi:hypothetical protein
MTHSRYITHSLIKATIQPGEAFEAASGTLKEIVVQQMFIEVWACKVAWR